MKFIIIGSNIHNLTNAYLLAKSGYEVTIIEDNNYNHIKNDSILFDFYPNLINKKTSLSNKLGLDNLFAGKKTFNDFNKIISKNNSTLQNFIKTENINFKNKKEGILYIYKNRNKFEKLIKQIKTISNYQSFTKINSGLNIELMKMNNKFAKNQDLNTILLTNKFTIDKDQFLEDLKEICQKKYNVRFEKVEEINNILTNHQKITGLNTDKGVFIADKYIINFNSKNLLLLKGININLKLSTSYKINIFDKIKNINNYLLKYNIIDEDTGIFYNINDIFCKLSIKLSNNDYHNIKSRKNMDYFTKIAQLTILDIKDYKNIKYYFEKQEYIYNKNPMICKSKKYNNLFLNGGYGSNYYNLSFGGAQILHNIILENN